MTQVVETADTRRPDNDDGGDYLAPERLARGGFTAASFESNHAFFNAIIRQVAATTGATLVDLATADTWTRNELYDDPHFSDNGSRRVAEIAAEVLAPIVAEAGKSKTARQPQLPGAPSAAGR